MSRPRILPSDRELVWMHVPDVARDHDDEGLPIRMAEVLPKQIGYE